MILIYNIFYFSSLTAWPLIRDVFFYSVSLILLVVFFLDERIYHYEAAILFFWYFAYVGFMRFNEGAEDALRKLFRLPESVSLFIYLHGALGAESTSTSWRLHGAQFKIGKF